MSPPLLLPVGDPSLKCSPSPALKVQEREPFVSELLTALSETIQDLQPHQIHTFYEAVGLMIAAEAEVAKREDYLVGGRGCGWVDGWVWVGGWMWGASG